MQSGGARVDARARADNAPCDRMIYRGCAPEGFQPSKDTAAHAHNAPIHRAAGTLATNHVFPLAITAQRWGEGYHVRVAARRSYDDVSKVSVGLVKAKISQWSSNLAIRSCGRDSG